MLRKDVNKALDILKMAARPCVFVCIASKSLVSFKELQSKLTL